MSSSSYVRVRRTHVIKTTDVKGQQSIPLHTLLGQKGVVEMRATLDELPRLEKMEQMQLGALAWDKVGDQQYRRIVTGVNEFEGLQVEISLDLSSSACRVDYQAHIRTRQALRQEQVEQQVQRMVNREVNHVLATTMAQKIEQRVQQQARQREQVQVRIGSQSNRVTMFRRGL